MSQKGFLSENELSDQIHKYFDLKLDKDALFKPTKDVVREIYKRFLDQAVPNWMKPKYPGHEPAAPIRMLYWMRVITQRLNTGYEFNMADLTTPTKKRTTAFLNVILYIRAVYDECLEIFEQCENRRVEQQEKGAMITQEINKIRVEVEDLAFKIGQAVGVDQLKAELGEDDRVLRSKKKECDDLDQEKALVKERIAKKEEQEVRYRVEMDDVNKKIDEYNRREDLVSKMSSVRERLETAESALQRLTIENDLKRAEEEHQLQMVDEEEKKFVHKISEEMKSLQLEIKSLVEEKQELKRKTDEDIRMTDEILRMAKQPLDEELKKRHLTAREDSDRDTKSLIQDYRVSLNKFFGMHDEPVQVDVSKNRTFIKSRND